MPLRMKLTWNPAVDTLTPYPDATLSYPTEKKLG